jgi:hypothetical protein
VLDQERPELLAARNVLLQRLLLELPGELGSRCDPDIRGDQNLFDPLPELLVICVPELSNSRVELPDDRLPAPAQPLPEPPEPSTRLLPRGSHLRVGRLLYLARRNILDLPRLRRLFPLG